MKGELMKFTAEEMDVMLKRLDSVQTDFDKFLAEANKASSDIMDSDTIELLNVDLRREYIKLLKIDANTTIIQFIEVLRRNTILPIALSNLTLSDICKFDCFLMSYSYNLKYFAL